MTRLEGNEIALRGQRNEPKFVPIRRVTVEDVAKMYRVPYWLVAPEPRPSWFRRPVWRFRAFIWSRGC